jgi:uncharacterized membrane protein
MNLGNAGKQGKHLIFLICLCGASSVLRWIITGNRFYFSINWNLFLAAVPFFITLLLTACEKVRKSKPVCVALVLVWFLFFPNAPYIITDLVYLRGHGEAMFWYDTCMILLFSCTGLALGFQSLQTMEGLFLSRINKIYANIIAAAFLFVTAFGIYLGRDLRWNSWDVFRSPVEFALDVTDRLIHPAAHGRTWGFTATMGVFLNALYLPARNLLFRKR